jgi:hypothetical protein
MWKLEWIALSSRIAGITDASTFLFQNSQKQKIEHVYSTDILTENCTETARSVIGLLRYGGALPARATVALTRFDVWWKKTSDWLQTLRVTHRGLDTDFQYLEACVVLLASIRSELDHLLADQDAIIRSHVNRAFRHLQRSLIADTEIQKKWQQAFSNDEYACEKLGAVHLLLHGIWAFKANSAGQRTDLVLGTHLVIDNDLIGTAHGLVLTEWKLVRQGDDPEKKKNEAKFQASLYSEIGLAGFELDSERYLVLVGEREFDVPKDVEEKQISYKVVPLFLTREAPSVAAKRRG